MRDQKTRFLAIPLPSESLRQNLFLVALCLLPVLIFLPAMGTPFERDEGAYATIAQGVLEGKVPYRDLFDNKPPLVYAWYALSFAIFGETVVAPRLIAALLLSLTTLCIFSQARMLFSREVAYIAAGLFAVSTGLPFVALHANTEAYMLLPMVSSLLAFTMGMRKEKLGWFLLAGALGGVAIMTKQVAVWNLLALAGVATYWRWRSMGGTWQTLTPASALFAGAIVSIGVIAMPFIVNGSFDDLFYANVSYNWVYINVLDNTARALNLFHGSLYFSAAAAPLVGGAVLALLTLLRRRRHWVDYLLVFWAAASFVGVSSGGRFFPHYFLHLMPALAILTAVVVYERWRALELRPMWRPAAIAVAFLMIVSIGTNAVMWFAPARAEQQIAESVYTQKQWEEATAVVGAYIQRNTESDERIFNFGREAGLYFYADREPAVRYFYDWPFWWEDRTLYETIKELRDSRPVFIIDSVQQPLYEDMADYSAPEFRSFLSKNYDYVGRLQFADIYRLREGS